MTFKDFLIRRYGLYKNKKVVPKTILNRINLIDLFKEDIDDYIQYLQSIEEVKTIPRYSL